MSSLMKNELELTAARLGSWIETEQFKGWDPYDALNSPLLRRLSFRSRLLSIVWVQLLMRTAVNLRPLLGIRKEHNAKAQGLLMAAYLRLYRLNPSEETLSIIDRVSSWLEENVATGYSGACWGFNFAWPNRSFFAPSGTPTIVNTSVVAGAFLDGYEWLGRESWLEVARSACDFIIKDLNMHEDSDGVCFSYTPLDHRRVHNANMLGAALLARVAKHTNEPSLKELAARAVTFTASRQRNDGSWLYGEAARDGWVDSYHTGMLLDALDVYREASGAKELDHPIERGLDYYSRRLFRDEYIPKFRSHMVYPIDIHCVAQAILTFTRFRRLDDSFGRRAYALASWARNNMLEESGSFHYQIRRYYRIRIPYLRWGQAWMLRALAELLGTPDQRRATTE